MIVTAHIKFSVGTTFLDNFFTAEDERLPGESIEDGVLRVRKHLENAVARLKGERLIGEEDLPPPSASVYENSRGNTLYSITSPQPTPEINLQHERIAIEIENAGNAIDLRQVKADHPLMPASLMNVYNQKMEELTNG